MRDHDDQLKVMAEHAVDFNMNQQRRAWKLREQNAQ